MHLPSLSTAYKATLPVSCPPELQEPNIFHETTWGYVKVCHHSHPSPHPFPNPAVLKRPFPVPSPPRLHPDTFTNPGTPRPYLRDTSSHVPPAGPRPLRAPLPGPAQRPEAPRPPRAGRAAGAPRTQRLRQRLPPRLRRSGASGFPGACALLRQPSAGSVWRERGAGPGGGSEGGEITCPTGAGLPRRPREAAGVRRPCDSGRDAEWGRLGRAPLSSNPAVTQQRHTHHVNHTMALRATCSLT